MSIKAITPDATTTAVWVGDVAVDTESTMEVVTHKGDVKETNLVKRTTEYARQCLENPASWRDVLKVHDGQKVTQFVIGTIAPSTMARIADENARSPESLKWEAFKEGLVDIINGPTERYRKDGVWVDEVPKVKVGERERVDPQWLERTFVRSLRKCGASIGLIIWAWNTYGDEDAKN